MSVDSRGRITPGLPAACAITTAAEGTILWTKACDAARFGLIDRSVGRSPRRSARRSHGPERTDPRHRSGRQLGAVRRTVTGLLVERRLPVRAMVRREDDRAAPLRSDGAEGVVGDLLEPADVYRVVSGSRRVYFGMSVLPG